MGRKLAEHLGSILLVALVFGVLILALQKQEANIRLARVAGIESYLTIPSLDFGDPLDRALFEEALTVFRPDSARSNEEILRAIDAYREALFTDPTLKTGVEERGLSWPVLRRLSEMYGVFVGIFGVVLLLTLYAAQTLATYRFIQVKQGRDSTLRMLLAVLGETAGRHTKPGRALRTLQLIVKAGLKGIFSLVLFSPAYVIGYALKTRIETDNLVFLALLALLSNGLLITYTEKFYTLLASESRKGYVETALAKGLSGSWEWRRSGLRPASVLRISKRFPSHVLGHIYLNASYQYLPTLKEQGSFLITGLIIIEMALNIQGHLGYDLLQRVLYKEYDVAIAITFGIFLMVKITEIVVDLIMWRKARKYENVA